MKILFLTVAKMFRTIRLLLTFYRSFFFANLLIPLVCLALFREYGMGIFSTLFWLKAATLALTFYYITRYKNKEFYYYQNLGLSRFFLWTTTLGFDLVVYLFAITRIYRLSL